MKEFLKSRSYDMVKMFLNQFAIAIFGVGLAFAAGKAGNPVLRNVSSVFSILFYLFLLYVMTWDIGFHDKTGVDLGKKKCKPLTGLWISLCANIPNFLFAISISLAAWFNVPFFSKWGAVSTGAAVLLEGMYTGLLANHAWGNPLNSYWWIYFLLPIPAMLTCMTSYMLGLNDKNFMSLFTSPYPESDREPKQKKNK